jgi:peptide/nickel transport system permease protein
MIRHIVASLGSAVLLMLGAIVLIFVIQQLTPGDPIQAIVGEQTVPAALRATLEMHFHVHDALPVRLYHYVAGVLHGDLGNSFQSQIPVATLIAERAPRTIILASTGFGLAMIVGVLAGVWAASTQSRGIDTFLTVASLVGYSIPTFWLGQLLVIVFALRLGWFPTQGMGPVFSRATGFGVLAERLPYLVLPMIAYSIHEGTRIARLMRASMGETLSQNHITTARMKGLSQGAILRGHALRNSFLPVVTAMGYAFSVAMGGTILIETVFSWPGIGLLLVDAVRARDNQLVAGIVLFVAFCVVTVNLIVDLLYAWLDPRIRAQS